MFNVLTGCQTVFWSGFSILHSHHQCRRAPIAPHPCQHLVWSVDKIVTVLIGMWWYLLVALMYLFLITKNVHCLFVCLFAILVSSLVKCLFKFRPFCIELSVFLLLSSKDYLCIWIHTLYQVFAFQMFFPRLWLVFSFA